MAILNIWLYDWRSVEIEGTKYAQRSTDSTPPSLRKHASKGGVWDFNFLLDITDQKRGKTTTLKRLSLCVGKTGRLERLGGSKPWEPLSWFAQSETPASSFGFTRDAGSHSAKLGCSRRGGALHQWTHIWGGGTRKNGRGSRWSWLSESQSQSESGLPRYDQLQRTGH